MLLFEDLLLDFDATVEKTENDSNRSVVKNSIFPMLMIDTAR